MGKGSEIPVISTMIVLMLILGAFLFIVPDAASGASVPSAPLGLTATPGDELVILNWNAPSDDGGSTVTNYKLYRGTTSGGETLFTTVGNVHTFTCRGRINGVTYYYKVGAVNAIGEGPLSNEAYATPQGVDSVPSNPTGLKATPGDKQVVLAWKAPFDDGGKTITNYKVYRGMTAGGETLLTTLGNVLSYTNTDLTNGLTYHYRVSAVNSLGEGGKSSGASATPTAPYTVPSAPTLFSATPDDGQVVLVWTAPSNGGAAITNYTVYRGLTSGGETQLTTLGDVLTYTDIGRTNGQTYFYKVSAVNSVGEGAQSNELSAEPISVPTDPQNLLATPGDAYINLTWQAPTSNGGSAITDFRIWRGTTSGTETFLADAGPVLWFNDTGLTNGQIYYYKVIAVNSLGGGPLSVEVSAIPVTFPSAPTLTYAIPGDGQVELGWTAPSNGGSVITGYEVYRGTVPGGESLVATLGNELTYTDTGRTNDQIYYYRVSAINSVGVGPLSDEVSATPATIPSGPTDLEAIPGDAVVELSWAAPTYVGPGTLIYHLFRNGSEVWSGTAMTFSDTSVVNGVMYSYQVAAQNSIGWGPNCTVVQATPISVDTVPSMPGGLTTTPGNEQVELEWTVPAYQGPGLITYHLFRDGAEVWSGTTTFATDSMLTKGVQYSYAVASQNSIGWGPNCSAVLATPFGIPDAPWGLSVTSSDGRSSLSWNAVNYTGPGQLTYHLFRDGMEMFNGTINNYDDTGLVNGQTYIYNVAVSNSVGWSANSSSANGTPQGPSGAPVGLEARPGDGFILLKWTSPIYVGPGTITYHLFRNGTHLWSGTSMTYNDSVVVNEISYTYSVSAQNEVGWGANSSTVSATPSSVPIIPPGAPEGLEADAGDGSVTLTWNAPSQTGSAEISGYNVYRSNNSGSSFTLVASPSGTTYTDTDIVVGQTYWYKVSAVNVQCEGAQCPAVSATLYSQTIFPLTGRIVDSRGIGLPNITVALENGTSVETDDKGDFTIMVSTGGHNLTISGDGIETRTVSANVTDSSLDMGLVTTTESTEGSSNDSNDYLPWAIVVGIAIAVLVGALLIARRRGSR